MIAWDVTRPGSLLTMESRPRGGLYMVIALRGGKAALLGAKKRLPVATFLDLWADDLARRFDDPNVKR